MENRLISKILFTLTVNGNQHQENLEKPQQQIKRT